MNTDRIISALTLPPETRVDQRVPKKLLVENGAPTAADKRQINEGIEELQWLATLKPTTIGVSEYRDDVREYLEIAVLSLTLRPDAKTGRLVELIHRAIPYPLLLVTELSDHLTLSLAHKRWSQGEAGKMVLDDAVTLCDLTMHTATGHTWTVCRWPYSRELICWNSIKAGSTARRPFRRPGLRAGSSYAQAVKRPAPDVRRSCTMTIWRVE